MGPLAGVKVIELAGIGPGPFCGMMLADMGAEVTRVERATSVPAEMPAGSSGDVASRGKQSIGVDLKNPDGVEAVLRMVEQADILIEGFRPGVTERMGLGPETCLERNPALVYGRMTGWGQDGPYAHAAGHDINYIALSGVLSMIGRKGEGPVPPLNLVGDFGGGGMFLAFGVVAALVNARANGQGQVVDASMVDGAATLAAMFSTMTAAGHWVEERGSNMLDTGAHFYDVYECADGEYVSIGSIEPQFYSLLLEKLELDPADLPHQLNKADWPAMKVKVAELFKAKTRDEWSAIMEHTDICFAPVLRWSEAPNHPHNVARSTFIDIDGITQPAPAPRFSATPTAVPAPPPFPGQHTSEALAGFGFDADEIAALKDAGAVA
jgi:alpha-methylacyl-CoA racemase